MTSPTGVIDIRKCSDEELKTMLDEARKASKHSRKSGRVMGIVAAHRLKHTRELLMYEELAIWRRMNGFDRVAEDEESCFHGHRLLPPTPEQYYAGLWSVFERCNFGAETEGQQTHNAIEQGKLSDEEYATLKRLVEKRDRETAQVTATPVDTEQHCSPCPLNSDMPPDVCFNLENEGRMDPELEELKSSSAGTGLETPGQQCPPYEGIWEQGRTIANGILTAGVDSSKKGNNLSSTERATSTVTVAAISSNAATPSKRRHKTFSEENKQFDPGGREDKAPPWDAAVPLLCFYDESWEATCLCFVCLHFVCALFFCFPKLFFSTGDHFSA